MLNAMLHTIITEGLTDQQYIAGYTEGFDELAERIKEFPPEKMEAICGIPAETLKEVARIVCALARLDHLLGHGHQPAHPRHRQCALPDRAGADRRARSAVPAPACIRCAARTTCRAPPTPA